MSLPLVTKASLGVIAISALLADNINVQLSGAAALGVVGSALALLIGLLGYFIRTQFEEVKGTQKKHGEHLHSQDLLIGGVVISVKNLNDWKDEREKAHEEANKEQLRMLQGKLEKRNGG